MSGADFLALAARLATGSEEAEWRSASSRAYYAAFHAARDLFERIGFSVPHADVAHYYLYVRLNNSGDAGLVRAAADLRELRRRRNQGDYDLHIPHPQSWATSQIPAARRVIQALAAVTTGPTRTQLRDAIIAYERTAYGQTTWSPPPP